MPFMLMSAPSGASGGGRNLGRRVASDVLIEAQLGERCGVPVYLARHGTFETPFEACVLDVTGVPPVHVSARLEWAERASEALASEASANVGRLFGAHRLSSTEVAVLFERVAGPSLAHLLETGRDLEVQARLDVLRQVARGLRDAHRIGVGHGRLESASVIVTVELDRPAAVKVVGLGLDELMRRDEPPAPPEHIGRPLDIRRVRLDLLAFADVVERCLGAELGVCASLVRTLRAEDGRGYGDMAEVVGSLDELAY